MPWGKFATCPSPDFRPAQTDLASPERLCLFNSGTWLPRQPLPIAVLANLNQDPWLSPTGTIVPQGYGANASLTIAGTFTLAETGVYSLSVFLAGMGTGGNFTFTEAGTVTFSLNQVGTDTNGVLNAGAFTLTQTANLSWTFTQQGWFGPPTNLSGNDSFSLATTTSPGDNYHLYAFNWYDLTLKISDLHNLNLLSGPGGANAWNTLSVGETGTVSLFTFQETSLSTLTGLSANLTDATGLNQPPGSLPQPYFLNPPPGSLAQPYFSNPGGDTKVASKVQYNFTRAASTSFLETGNGTFTLSEAGTYGSGFSLSSVAYAESFTSTTSLTQTASETLTGSAALTYNTLLGGGQLWGSANATLAYSLTNNAGYTYRENAAGTHTLAERGTYSGGQLNLSSIAYNQTAAGS